MALDLFILCRREGCENIRRVFSVSEQRRAKFCSHRCSALVHQQIKAAVLKGVTNSARIRRERMLQRVEGLDPLEAYHLGYRLGKEGKLTHVRRRYVLVPRARFARLVRLLDKAS